MRKVPTAPEDSALRWEQRRWQLAFGITAGTSLIVFVNHAQRDVVGALSKEFQVNTPHLSSSEYSLLNSFFFSPNVIAPLIASAIISRVPGGAISVMIGCCIMMTIGGIFFAYGGSMSGERSMGLFYLYFGRFLGGLSYEVIDMTPIIFLPGVVGDHWGTVCGIMNSFLRLGSVFVFFVCPVLYRQGGVPLALWVSCIIVAWGIFFSLGVRFCNNAWLKMQEERTGNVIDSTTKPQNRDEEQSGEMDSQQQGPNVFQSIVHFIKSTFPFISMQYYFYLTAGACLYGCIVPFWFIGGKFLQNTYFLSLEVADQLMLLPEGLIVIASIPLGILVDRYRISARRQLFMLAIACLHCPLSYMLLIWGRPNKTGDKPLISPYFSMILLGLAYSICNSLFWTAITKIIPAKHLNPGSALLASGMNFLPSLIPFIITAVVKLKGISDAKEEDVQSLTILSIVGLVSFAFLIAAALSQPLPFGVSAFDVNSSSSANTSTSSHDSIVHSPLPQSSEHNGFSSTHDGIELTLTDEEGINGSNATTNNQLKYSIVCGDDESIEI